MKRYINEAATQLSCSDSNHGPHINQRYTGEGFYYAVNLLPAAAGSSSGLDFLEQRYARGEVNREEYLQKKGDLQA